MKFWAFLIPISMMIKNQVDIGVHISATDFLFILICILIILAIFIKINNFDVKYTINNHTFKIYAIIIGIAVVSLISDIHNNRIPNITLTLLFLIIKLFVFRVVLLNKGYFSWCLIGTRLVIVMTVFLIILETIGLLSIDPTKSPSGSFQNKNNFALFIVGYFLLEVIYMYQYCSKNKQFPFVISLLLSLSLELRSTSLAILAARFRKRLIFLFIIITTFSLAVPGEYNLQRIISSGSTAMSISDDTNLRSLDDASAGLRVILAAYGYNYFLEKPYLGHGSGAFKANTVILEKNLSPHNTFILILVETGLFGFLLFVVLIFYTSRNRDIGLFIAITLIIICLFTDIISENIFAYLLAASTLLSMKKNMDVNKVGIK